MDIGFKKNKKTKSCARAKKLTILRKAFFELSTFLVVKGGDSSMIAIILAGYITILTGY